MEVEEVRNPIRDRSVGRARHRSVPVQNRLSAKKFILPPHDSDIHAHALPRDAFFAITGVLNGLPGGFEKQPFLWIDQVGFSRRYVEEQWIEFIHVGNKAAPLAVAFSELVAIGIEIQRMIPAFWRDFGDAIAAILKIGPKLLQILGLRISSRDANDGDIP